MPNQRVIVFQADLSSGDTLGYHGIIVQLQAKSRFQYPNDPERWVYRVSIPSLGRQVDVASMDLFATEALNDFPLRLETDRLDRQFVLRAIAGIIGTEKVHDD